MGRNIGIIAGCMGGIDGVSLETDKWVKVLKKMGHKNFICTGQVLDGKGYSPITGDKYEELEKAKVIKEMGFWTKKNKWIDENIKKVEEIKLKKIIEKEAIKIKDKVEKWIKEKKIDLLIIQNASAIPMQLPLGKAIHDIVNKLSIETIFHHHDFAWERERYNSINGAAKEYIDRYFPFDHKKATHIVINSIAKKELKKRKNISSTIIPNIFDFSHELKMDDYNNDFKKDFGIREDTMVVSVPVRIIERKNIETAIKITADLEQELNERITLIFGYTTPGKEKYEGELRKMSRKMGVNFTILGERLAARRKKKRGKKMYTPWDIFPNSDFVIYPSNYEGWGNTLLEGVAAKKIIAVKKYPVYKTDIKKYGFEFIEFEDYNKKISKKIAKVIRNEKEKEKIVGENFEIAKKKLSLVALERMLEKII